MTNIDKILALIEEAGLLSIELEESAGRFRGAPWRILTDELLAVSRQVERLRDSGEKG